MRKEDIIKIEAQEFYEFRDWKGKQIFPSAQDLVGDLKLELSNHQSDSQIIYLKEVIRLIDIDYEKHLKTCKYKDKPDECLSHQFYVKSKYYIEQILVSIVDQIESIETEYDLKDNLATETLLVIEVLLDGKKYSLTKNRSKEISEIIERLNNLGFVNKVTKYSYAVNNDNRKYLSKLLELKSWNKFKEWLNKKEDYRETSVTNIFKESTVGQFNQAVAGSIINNPKTKNQESSKTSLLNKLYWIIGIIVSLIVVYEFVIKQFVK